jgi:hypothetical protein
MCTGRIHTNLKKVTDFTSVTLQAEEWQQGFTVFFFFRRKEVMQKGTAKYNIVFLKK